MKFRNLTFVLISIQIFQVFGSLHNLPCRSSTDAKALRCSTNHIIYIVNHVLQDGFQRLSLLDEAFGCNVENSVYCGQYYPINSTITANSNVFKRAISTCNGKNSCTLSKQYFEDSENLFRNNCPNLKPDVMVRQSIEYECIPEIESSVIDMCEHLNVSRMGNIYLKANGTNKICRCEILGAVSGLVILRSYKTSITTDQGFRYLSEKMEKENNIVYGRSVSIRSDRLFITVNLTSSQSVILFKVLIDVNAASFARAESIVFVTEAPTTDTTLISKTDRDKKKTGDVKSLLSTTESADFMANVQVNKVVGTDQEHHGWLVTATILAFLVVTPLVIWKFKLGKNTGMTSAESTDCRNNGKELTAVEKDNCDDCDRSSIQLSSEKSHKVEYTRLILSNDSAVYEEPVHFSLPPPNTYIEVLPNLDWETKEIHM